MGGTASAISVGEDVDDTGLVEIIEVIVVALGGVFVAEDVGFQDTDSRTMRRGHVPIARRPPSAPIRRRWRPLRSVGVR